MSKYSMVHDGSVEGDGPREHFPRCRRSYSGTRLEILHFIAFVLNQLSFNWDFLRVEDYMGSSRGYFPFGDNTSLLIGLLDCDNTVWIVVADRRG